MYLLTCFNAPIHRWNHLAVTRLVSDFEGFDFPKDFPHAYRCVQMRMAGVSEL